MEGFGYVGKVRIYQEYHEYIHIQNHKVIIFLHGILVSVHDLDILYLCANNILQMFH